MSGLTEWLSAFKELHEKARKQQLSEGERATYLAAREELARALLAAQRISAPAGRSPRQVLRISRALQVNLDWSIGADRALTLDLSIGGFGTLLAKPPPADEDISFALRVPGGGEPVRGKARVVEVKAQQGNARVSFAFSSLPEAEVERIELFLFDAVLAQLAG